MDTSDAEQLLHWLFRNDDRRDTRYLGRNRLVTLRDASAQFDYVGPDISTDCAAGRHSSRDVLFLLSKFQSELLAAR